MRAMRAGGFSGYKDLRLVDVPEPTVSDGRVMVRIKADALRYLIEGRPFGRVVLTI